MSRRLSARVYGAIRLQFRAAIGIEQMLEAARVLQSQFHLFSWRSGSLQDCPAPGQQHYTPLRRRRRVRINRN